MNYHWTQLPDDVVGAYTNRLTAHIEAVRIENGVMEMPQHYALEMIADWMGASKTYTGSWDMSDWLAENMNKIRVHSKTAKYLREVLSGLPDIVRPEVLSAGRFANEL